MAKPASRILIKPSTLSGGPARLLPRTRWAEWVRALAERWGRGSERNGRLAMVLLRPLTVTRHLRERWLLKSQRFSPKINLSVQVFLRATSSTVFAHASSRDLTLADRRFQGVERVAPGEVVIPRGLAPSAGYSGDERSGSRAADRGPVKPGRIEVMSPLERVFVRSESLIEPREMARCVRLEKTLERLTGQSRRIESHFSSSATTRPAIAYSVNQTKVVSAASDNAETPVSIPGFDVSSQTRINREPGWDPSQLSRGGSEISIERITDQVIRQLDRRVVAARERVGRTF